MVQQHSDPGHPPVDPETTKGTGHSIEIAPSSERIVISFNGETVADSKRALILEETGYPPVAYLPLDDVREGALSPSEHTTHCPFKGDARYWHLSAGGRTAENAVWGYPDPSGAVAEIEDFVAFYVGKVEGLEQRSERA